MKKRLGSVVWLHFLRNTKNRFKNIKKTLNSNNKNSFIRKEEKNSFQITGINVFKTVFKNGFKKHVQ